MGLCLLLSTTTFRFQIWFQRGLWLSFCCYIHGIFHKHRQCIFPVSSATFILVLLLVIPPLLVSVGPVLVLLSAASIIFADSTVVEAEVKYYLSLLPPLEIFIERKPMWYFS